MSEYDFELSFTLPSDEADPEQYVEPLYEVGCNDALLGIGRRGSIGLMFTREAGSAEEGLLSAIKDVMGAIPGARLVEASPDLVGLSDVAELLGVSRQNVRKLIVDSSAKEPPAVHDGNPTLWHLAELLHWLRDQKAYKVDQRLLEVAETTMQVNLAVGCKAADRRAQKEILALLA